MLNHLSIVMRRGLGTVRDAPAMSVLVASTIGATLLVSGLYVMALRNMETLVGLWQQGDVLTVYVADTVPETQWDVLRSKLERTEGVTQATLITPQMALQRFRDRGPQAAALVEGVEDSMLPATITLRVSDGLRRDPQGLQHLALAIEASDGVSDLDFGQEEVAQLDALLRLLRWIGVVVGSALALITALIISNTVRLTIYGRREEIAIWQLVGATRWFVGGPFLVEGMAWGMAGGVLAAIALACVHHLGAASITRALSDVLDGWNIDLFAWDVSAELVLTGIILGALGSLLAVRRVADQAETA